MGKRPVGVLHPQSRSTPRIVLSYQFSRRISVLVMPAYSSNVNHWEADPEGTFALELGGRFMVVEDLSLVRPVHRRR